MFNQPDEHFFLEEAAKKLNSVPGVYYTLLAIKDGVASIVANIEREEVNQFLLAFVEDFSNPEIPVVDFSKTTH